MKGALMRVSDKLLLRKRTIIETVDDELKNIAQVGIRGTEASRTSWSILSILWRPRLYIVFSQEALHCCGTFL